MNEHTAAAGQLSALRRSFDRSFAVPPGLREEGLEQLLLIRVAGEAVVLKTLHIAGLARMGRILPVPSRIPELLGITGIRGTVAPVFDLAALLGLKTGGVPLRWLAFPSGEMQIALAFDQIEGQIAVSRTSLYEHQAGPAGEHINQAARIGQAVRPVADIPAVLEGLRRRAGLNLLDKE